MRRLLPCAAAIVLVVASCGGDHPLDEVDGLAAAEHYSNGREAAGALATIGERAIGLQRSCLRGDDERPIECESYGVLAAWAQVSAVRVAKCSRAEATETRAHLLELLDGVRAVVDGEAGEAPPVPDTPTCG